MKKQSRNVIVKLRQIILSVKFNWISSSCLRFVVIQLPNILKWQANLISSGMHLEMCK